MTSLALSSNHSVVTLYRSGANAPADLRGFIGSNVPIGVNALDLGDEALLKVASYADTMPVFVDSGAFRLFKTGETLDFDSVLHVYRRLISATRRPENLSVVGPDVIGCQWSSLRLLQRYADDLIGLMETGAHVMAPLQKGALPIHEVARIAYNSLGRWPVFGLPSNAEALSEDEIVDLVRLLNVPRIHFLGCKPKPLFDQLRSIAPQVSISCDAATLRQHVGRRRRLTRKHHDLRDKGLESSLRGEGAHPEWDITEFYAYLPQLICYDKTLERSLAKALGTTGTRLLKAIDDDYLDELIHAVAPGYEERFIDHWWSLQACRTLSPLYRSEAIVDLCREGYL